MCLKSNDIKILDSDVALYLCAEMASIHLEDHKKKLVARRFKFE